MAMTAQELANLPARGARYELQRGKLIRMTPAGFRHGDIAMVLGALLLQYVRQKGLGKVLAAETGYKLSRDPDTVRAPDVSFVRQNRVPQGDAAKGFLELAPDLAVEVVSPNDRAGEVYEKVAEWLMAGTRLVWVVYPDTKTITVYRSLKDIEVLTTADTLQGEEVIPGFTCPVAEIFA